MKDMNIIEKLKFIKLISFILLMISAAFIAFGPIYIIAIPIMVFSLFLQWRFYRCPHCNKSLDVRMDLNEEIHCPYCGKKLL